MSFKERFLARTLLTGCFLFFTLLIVVAQDSLYIYKGGQIIYRSQADQIDSVTFHLPEYWDWAESDAVYKKIRSYPELSIFADMLEQTGYKDHLNDKTIWAPVNSSFTGVDLSDGDLVKKLVENHLLSNSPPYQYAIDGHFPLKLVMINNKVLEATHINSQFFMDGIRVIQPNIPATTSVIHFLDGILQYKQNIWEYLSTATMADSMRTFLFSYNKKTYNSVTRDTTITNDLLSSLYTFPNNELRDYTVLIPDDQVWTTTFDSLMKIYPATTNQKLLAQQRTNVKLYMIKHLFILESASELLNDTIWLASNGKEITDPIGKFGAPTPLAQLSNGRCYSISKLYIPPLLQHGIRVEGEDSIHRNAEYCTITNRKLIDKPGFTVSNNAYNYCFPLTSSLAFRINVLYDITNLKPGKYNIYAQFVPAFAEDTTLQTPYKVNFYLTYPDSAGVSVSNKLLLSNVVTNPKAMTKVLVQQNFVYNLFDPQINSSYSKSLRLKIENAAKASESATLSREIRTDCIIFEPVE